MAGIQDFWKRFEEFRPVAMIQGKVRNKLILSSALVAILPLSVLSAVLYFEAESALEHEAFAELEALAHEKHNEVEEYFHRVHEQVRLFARDPRMIEGMEKFRETADGLTTDNAITDVQLKRMRRELLSFYKNDFDKEFRDKTGTAPPDPNNILKRLDDETVVLQHLYIRSNPNGIGHKEKLDTAGDGSRYSRLHQEYHPGIRDYAETWGYHDIFLVDSSTGRIVYSSAKEIDFGTSLTNGPWADTSIGQIFREANATTDPNYTAFKDFEHYAPSFLEPESYVATPIFDGRRHIGVAIFQLPIGHLHDIAEDRVGLGETGENMFVGVDNELRAELRFIEEVGISTAIMNADFEIDQSTFEAAHDGEEGHGFGVDYRGEPVLEAWAPIVVHPNDDPEKRVVWAAVTKIDVAEEHAPILVMAETAGVGLSIAILLVVGAAIFSARSLTRQVDAIQEVFGQVGIGNFNSRTEVLSQDELGSMAIALNATLDTVTSLVQSQDERDSIQKAIGKLMGQVTRVADGDLTEDAEVTEDITGSIADAFNFMLSQLREVIGGVVSATTKVSGSASQTRLTADEVATGTEEQARQIVDASAAIDEMAISIEQVATTASEASEVAEQSLSTAQKGRDSVTETVSAMEKIREHAQDTAKRIKGLGERSQEIGEIVQLISDIADRTSILALNASIQAAMAGDAGRGFSVVAEEVERLSIQSAESAKQIGGLIRRVQSETNDAVTAVEESTREVVVGSRLAVLAGDSLSEIETVSGKVGEMVQSISQAAQQQSRGAKGLAKTMSSISEITTESAASTRQAAGAVGEIAELSDELRASVATFKLPEQPQG